MPIIHVNADDVEACIAAVRLAMAYRERFGRDVLIDLIGYRRFGHNETDEPAYTQPQMYERIKKHPPVRKLYADRLAEQGLISREESDQMVAEAHKRLADAHAELKESIEQGPDTGEHELDRSASAEPRTAVSAEDAALASTSSSWPPDGFNVHRKLKPQLERRRGRIEEGAGIDWAHAEALAFASLLALGVPIRLTGQDTERGTFSQRHLVLHDAETGDRYAPIQNLPKAEVPFELHNSPLSGEAALGFEYGYSAQAPETLVIWEAQFGDFVNGAQVIVDQFIVSGLAKWGQTSRLTLLLPHGYEGRAPSTRAPASSASSSSRRRGQHPRGQLHDAGPVLPPAAAPGADREAAPAGRDDAQEPAAPAGRHLDARGARRGRLPARDRRPGAARLARRGHAAGAVHGQGLLRPDRPRGARPGATTWRSARVELLYPFPETELGELMESYPALETVVWAQEEPKNMGARNVMEPRLAWILPDGVKYDYVGRQLRASPGEGYAAAHKKEQARIVRVALGVVD